MCGGLRMRTRLCQTRRRCAAKQAVSVTELVKVSATQRVCVLGEQSLEPFAWLVRGVVVNMGSCDMHGVHRVRHAVRQATVSHAVEQPQRLRQHQAQRQQGAEPSSLMQLSLLHAADFNRRNSSGEFQAAL